MEVIRGEAAGEGIEGGKKAGGLQGAVSGVIRGNESRRGEGGGRQIIGGHSKTVSLDEREVVQEHAWGHVVGRDELTAGGDAEAWEGERIEGNAEALLAATGAEEEGPEEHIELIASENYTSKRVMEAQGRVLR
ncbi:hypothetical protein B1218_37155, partial [Pseudomonas ogarae]